MSAFFRPCLCCNAPARWTCILCLREMANKSFYVFCFQSCVLLQVYVEHGECRSDASLRPCLLAASDTSISVPLGWIIFRSLPAAFSSSSGPFLGEAGQHGFAFVKARLARLCSRQPSPGSSCWKVEEVAGCSQSSC